MIDVPTSYLADLRGERENLGVAYDPGYRGLFVIVL